VQNTKDADGNTGEWFSDYSLAEDRQPNPDSKESGFFCWNESVVPALGYFKSNARRNIPATAVFDAGPSFPRRLETMFLDKVTSLSSRISESAFNPVARNSGSDRSSSTSAPRGDRFVRTLVMNARIISEVADRLKR